MSAQAAAPLVRPAAPRRAPAPASTEPRIHLVSAPLASRSRVPFILVCMTILVGALVSVLVLNTTMAGGSYEQRELQSQLSELAQREQALLAQLDQEASPEVLAARAEALGMVQDSTPAFVRLADAKVIGDPTPAKKR